MITMKRAALAVGLLYVCVLLLSGFFLHRTVAADTFITIDDYHYSLVIGSALRVALGDAISTLRINFGLLSTLSAGLLGRLFAIDSYAGWIRLIQVFQVLFLIFAVISAWAFQRDRRLVWVVLFISAPFACTVSPFVLTPNNSGLRYLGIALLPLALALLRASNGYRGSVIAGLACGLFVLWNTETGIACSAALLFYLTVSEFAARRPPLAVLGLLFIASAIAAAAIIVVLVAVLGSNGGIHLLLEHLIGHLKSDYNGHLFDKWSGAAAVLALYASTVVIHCCLMVRAGSTDRYLIARAAIAVASIVWFAYYAHNAFYFVLWFNLFLLLFTIEPILATGKIAVLGVVLLAVACNIAGLRPVPGRFTTKPVTVQGLSLPEDMAVYLRRHAELLQSIHAERMIYITGTPFITAVMTRKVNDLSVFDPFGETWTESQFHQLIQDVLAQKPTLILLDIDASPLLDAPRRQFQHRVREAISGHFSLTKTQDGFEFWTPSSGGT
jgi:hypothetical protein